MLQAQQGDEEAKRACPQCCSRRERRLGALKEGDQNPVGYDYTEYESTSCATQGDSEKELFFYKAWYSTTLHSMVRWVGAGWRDKGLLVGGLNHPGYQRQSARQQEHLRIVKELPKDVNADLMALRHCEPRGKRCQP